MTSIITPVNSPFNNEAAKKLGFEFEALDEQEQDRYVTLLYYGGSAVGKTYFVATAGPRTLIVNIGNGLVTIRGPVVRERFYKEGLPIVTTIREERDPVTGIFKSADAWDKVADAIDFALANFSDKFDTIAIDDASQLKVFAMNKGLELSGELNRSQTLKTMRASGVIFAAKQDFGMEMSLVEQFIAGTVELCKRNKKHLILTAHERYVWKEIRDEKGRSAGEVIDKIRPGFTGRTFPDDVTKHFDLVWQAEVIQANPNPVYRAHTEDSKTIKAKSRYPGVFDALEFSPNFLDMVKRIRSSLDGKILPKPSALRKTPSVKES